VDKLRPSKPRRLRLGMSIPCLTAVGAERWKSRGAASPAPPTARIACAR
jgi:hypothetical protein